MTEQQPQGSQGEGAIDEILRLRAAISAALDAWPEHTRTDEHEAAVGEVLTAVLPEVTKMLSGPDRADTELADLRAEVERLRSAEIDWMGRYGQLTDFAREIEAERDALQRQATRVRRYAESRAVTSRARGRTDAEREWLDVLALLDAVEPADQPHPTPEADEHCNSSGGHGSPVGHECRCSRKPGHALDPKPAHGCPCGALWSCPDCVEADPAVGCAGCGAAPSGGAGS